MNIGLNKLGFSEVFNFRIHFFSESSLVRFNASLNTYQIIFETNFPAINCTGTRNKCKKQSS